MRVITQTAGNGEFPFAVIRRPGALQLLREVRWCEGFLQNNISLRTLWPLLFVRRPLFIAHQTWITRPDGSIGWEHRLKRFVLRFATSLAISRAVADQLPGPSIQVGNPYDDKVFRELPPAARTRELIFAGRLVSDKGASLLLEAMALLKSAPRLTIAGDGPERASLERQAAHLGLQSRVDFVGSQTSEQLAALLRQHEILVVPSRWEEPFGIVALEGIACGCVVVGSAAGGLAEAIGPCGITFPNGDAQALAKALSRLIEDPMERARLRRNSTAHLARFTPEHVASLYLEAMQNVVR